MRSLRKYKAPKAEITKFECADVITVSAELGTSIKDNKPVTDGTGYVYVGKSAWADIKNK